MQFTALEHVIRDSRGREDGVRRFGGKGYHLSQLMKEGFFVPRGFVISTDIFDDLMGAALSQYRAEPVHDVVGKLVFPEAFVSELEACLRAIPARSWAVRSSSTDEDSHHHSYAGLLESVTGICSVGACLEAIRRVWQSFYARERLLYPSQAPLDGAVPSMAVIVEVFIEADAAGVVFTRHPIEGDQSILINVSRGAGETVVSGKGGEALCLAKREFCQNGGGLGCASECLDAEKIGVLGRTCLEIERYFGCPQDIEFAFLGERLWILQSRDIVENPDARHVLYSNVNVGEALSGVCSPLTWSLGMTVAQEGFKTIFGAFGLSVPENYTIVTTFDGHIYLNVSQILSLATQIPFVDPSLFGRIAGIKDIAKYAGTVEKISRSYFLRHLPQSLATLLKMQKRLKHLEAHAKTFRTRCCAMNALKLDELSHEALYCAFGQLNDIFFECAYDMLIAAATFLASYTLCSVFLERFNAQRDESLESYLFSGLLDVKSAAPGLKLLEMSEKIRQSPELLKCFLETSDFQDLETFRHKSISLPGGDCFWKAFESFLRLYGNRANQEAELANPRWREAPSFLFRVICTHLRASGEELHVKPQIEQVSEQRRSRTDQIKAMLSYSMRPVFRALLDWAQNNARLREEWRAYVVDVLGMYRQFYLSVARRMVAQDLLNKPEDIFYCTYDEIALWLKCPKNFVKARLKVAFRRARHLVFLSACRLPDTFVTHPNHCCVDGIEDKKKLYGLAASPGCVRARVRVAETLEDAMSLEYGEILVTQSTDVGWTPLFLVASAILTERGGPLSHAFVVAREYGVPAVVSIPGLLGVLKTGDIVTVYGQKGVVAIEAS